VYTIKAATVGSAITIDGNSFAWSGAAALAAASASNCMGVMCTPTQMAAYDLQSWANAVNAVLPNVSTLIKCGTITPVSCMVTITWSEVSVAANAQQAAAAQAATGNAALTAKMQIPTYTVYIEP
jgi:type IV pilus assembly protein PilV